MEAQMRKPKTKTALILGGAVVIVLAGGAGVAYAAGAGGDPERPAYTGSVRAPAQAGDERPGAPEATDAAEATALQPLAKITADQAKAAALAAVPGTAGQPQLQDEDGYVVYGVAVKTAAGATMDVKVDAGTGKVLAQERDDTPES